MSDNRVQKLLFSEYCDFEDMVLLESPFAQTTKDGLGIRQVHLGLTPSKLVLATDILPPVEYVNFKYTPGVDPLIETFELIAIYPVECVNLSIYRSKKNQALKARFCNNKVLYFEIGGFENRAMFWNLWCEKVKFFCPKGSGSSRSETSVGTSTTGSTLYLLDKKFIAANGMKQLWCTFGINPSVAGIALNETVNAQRLRNRWTDRHLYIGEDNDCNYTPVVEPPSLDEFIRTPRSSISKLGLRPKRSEIASYMNEKHLCMGDLVPINRFGNGVKEGCGTALYLTVDDYVVPRIYSHIIDEEEQEYHKLAAQPSLTVFLNPEQLAETAVLAWEFYKVSDPNKYKIRHRRRYGLATQPMFLYGFGPIKIPNGAKYSIQVKRAVSDVCLSLPKEHNLISSSVKGRLTASISHHLLTTAGRKEFNNTLKPDGRPLTYFWTPGYTYRPSKAVHIYKQRMRELKAIRDYHESMFKKKTRKRKRTRFGKNLLCNFYHNKISRMDTDDDSNDEMYLLTRPKKQGFIFNLLPYKDSVINADFNKPHESVTQSLKRILRIDRNMCAWDFDSTTLAEQLTMIDKDLMIKISPIELDIILWQQSSRNAPNINALLAFSQRIRCLFAFEVLKNECTKTRARMISRFVNVADKCHRMSNFHSTRSVLSALQTPAIYRLRETWSYLRKKHASKYQKFEYLSRFYRDPRMITFQKTVFIVAHNPPFLPYIGDIVGRLLGKIPEYPLAYKTSNSSISTTTTKSYPDEGTVNQNISFFHRFLKALALSDTGKVRETAKKARKRQFFNRKKVKVRGLYEYFKPFGWYEDNREENLEATKVYLEKGQLGAMNYNFSEDEMAKCYLLKARYHDDRENFIISLSVESPSNCYEPNLK